MGCGDPPPPQTVNYAETLGSQFQGQHDYAPLAFEDFATYQPQYNAESLRQLESLLMGSPAGTRSETYQETRPGNQGQVVQYRNKISGRSASPEQYATYTPGQSDYSGWYPVYGTTGDQTVTRQREVATPANRGLLDLYEKDIGPATSRIQAASQSAQRQGDLADIESLGPEYLAALKSANPETAALRDELMRQATADLGRTGLDAYDERLLDETVAGRFANTPFANTPRSELTAIMAKGDRGRALEDRRRGFALQTIGLDQALYGDPFLQITGRAGGSVPLAQSFFGQAGGVQQNAGPQLYVPESQNAFDIAGYNANAVNAANIAGANNSAGLLGSLIGAGGMLGGGWLAGRG